MLLVPFGGLRRVGELAQDVPEPSVHLFQNGHVLIGRRPGQPVQLRYGLIDPRVTRRRQARRRPSGTAFPRGGGLFLPGGLISPRPPRGSSRSWGETCPPRPPRLSVPPRTGTRLAEIFTACILVWVFVLHPDCGAETLPWPGKETPLHLPDMSVPYGTFDSSATAKRAYARTSTEPRPGRP